MAENSQYVFPLENYRYTLFLTAFVGARILTRILHTQTDFFFDFIVNFLDLKNSANDKNEFVSRRDGYSRHVFLHDYPLVRLRLLPGF